MKESLAGVTEMGCSCCEGLVFNTSCRSKYDVTPKQSNNVVRRAIFMENSDPQVKLYEVLKERNLLQI